MKLFTVGPTEMFPSTLSVAGEQVPYFRNEEFSSVMKECELLMKEFTVASDDSLYITLTASGTAAMEAVVMNCLGENDRVLVIDGGTFGHRFADLCQIHDVPFDSIRLDWGETLTKHHLEEAVSAKHTALLVNAHETSRGQLYDLDMLSSFCREHDLYFIVDAISSFCADEISMRDFSIDALIVSSQKGLALSPGLSFVLLSRRIFECRVTRLPVRSMYFDFPEYVANAQRGQTPFTPAVGIVYELLDRLKMIKRSGGIRSEINRAQMLANDFRSRIASIGLDVPSTPLSNSMTPIVMKHGAREMAKRLKLSYGYVVNPCGGEMADRAIRVSHMGNLTVEDNAGLVEAMSHILHGE